MGNNYYARRIPSKTKKELLKALIDSDDFHKITEQVNDLYGNYSVDYAGNASGGIVHLGKASSGWKFLWNPNWYVKRNFHKVEEDNGSGRIVSRFVNDSNTVSELYPLTKKGIKDFIDQPDIEIYDECGEKQDKEEFWDMALNWGNSRKDGGWDAKSYEEWEKERGHNYQTWPCTGELVNMIRQRGYEFTSESQSDFYSDGLRFATFNEFSQLI